MAQSSAQIFNAGALHLLEKKIMTLNSLCMAVTTNSHDENSKNILKVIAELSKELRLTVMNLREESARLQDENNTLCCGKVEEINLMETCHKAKEQNEAMERIGEEIIADLHELAKTPLYSSESPGTFQENNTLTEEKKKDELDCEENTDKTGWRTSKQLKFGCCHICSVTQSPEWRRGDGGVRNLCNACGLKLQKQKKVKEGKEKSKGTRKNPSSNTGVWKWDFYDSNNSTKRRALCKPRKPKIV